jgi:hypothetical protein
MWKDGSFRFLGNVCTYLEGTLSPIPENNNLTVTIFWNETPVVWQLYNIPENINLQLPSYSPLAEPIISQVLQWPNYPASCSIIQSNANEILSYRCKTMELNSHMSNMNKKLYLYNGARVVRRIPEWDTQYWQLSSLCLVSLGTPCAYDTSTCSQSRRWTVHGHNRQIITMLKSK